MISARQLVVQAVSATGINLWLALIGLVTTPYVLTGLGNASYGVMALLSVVAGYLLNLEFGFGFATVRFLAQAHASGDRAAEQTILDTAFTVFTAGGCVAGVTLLGASSFLVHSVFNVPAEIQGASVTALRISALGLAASFWTVFFSSTLQGWGRFGHLNAIRLATGTLSAAAAVAAVRAGWQLEGFVTGQVAVTLTGCLIFAGAFWRLNGRVRVRLERTALQQMGAFAGIVFATGLLYQLMLNGPTLVLARYVSSGAIPAYSVPQSLLQKLSMLMGSASIGFFSFASAASGSADRSSLARMFQSHLRLSLLAMGPLAAYLVVFADRLLSAWVSSQFAAGAAPCLRLLALAALVLALAAPAADVARALGRAGWVLSYTAVVASSGLFLTWTLVPSRGPVGAALGFLGGVLVGTAPLLLVVAKRLLRLSPDVLADTLARPALVVAVAAMSFLLARELGQGLPVTLVTGALVAVVYTACVFAWILDETERSVLRRSVGLA